jgi:hypothetical protein
LEKLEYSPEKNELNPADYISRHPIATVLKNNAGEDHIQYVCNNVIPKSMTVVAVQNAMSTDIVLQERNESSTNRKVG